MSGWGEVVFGTINKNIIYNKIINQKSRSSLQQFIEADQLGMGIFHEKWLGRLLSGQEKNVIFNSS